MAESAAPSAPASGWAVLRRAISSSSQRLELFAKVPTRELGLFVKDKPSEDEEGTWAGERVRYCGWSTLLPARPQVAAFAAVGIVKPAMRTVDDSTVGEAVDSTGLLRLYPSEEVLAAYMLIEAERFRNKSVIEIGAGFCGLAGLIFAKNAPSLKADVCLSDGSHEVLRLVRQHIEANSLQEGVRTKFLMWDRASNYADEEHFDFVVLSDCLYLDSIHLDLLNAIYHLLKDPSSTCIIISPSRYKSMDAFLDKATASGRFTVSTKSQEALSPLLAPLECKPFAPFLIEIRKRYVVVN